MGCDMKIIKTVLGRMFLSISWLKWFIVACSTIALYVFFYKDQMCPCPALFLFVCFFDKYSGEVTAWPIPQWSFREEKQERWGAIGGARAHEEQHWGCAKARRGHHRKWEEAQENLQAVSSAQSKK